MCACCGGLLVYRVLVQGLAGSKHLVSRSEAALSHFGLRNLYRSYAGLFWGWGGGVVVRGLGFRDD